MISILIVMVSENLGDQIFDGYRFLATTCFDNNRRWSSGRLLMPLAEAGECGNI